MDAVCDKLERAVGISNDDDELFKDPPPKEDCPLCFLPMPYADGHVCGVTVKYMPCCGKTLCCGCVLASQDEIRKGNIKPWCPFCRVPLPKSGKEDVKRYRKRMKLNEAEAFFHLGVDYNYGDNGLPKSLNKTMELLERAAELGSIKANYHLGNMYLPTNMGGKGAAINGVEEDIKKATHITNLLLLEGTNKQGSTLVL